MMTTLLQDIRYAARVLAKSPGFTAVAVLALALGVGANTAIFSVVKGVLLSPLPYPEPERLVWVWESNATNGILKEPASLPNYNDWRTQAQGFDGLAAFSKAALSLTAEGQEPERIPSGVVSANFLDVLGVAPAQGRGFAPEENTPGQNRVVVLSHGLWQRRFGGDPKIVGRPITLNGNPYTVVGILPPSFREPVPGPRSTWEMVIPLGFNFEQAGRRSDYLSVVGRLKRGVTPEQGRAELSAIAGRLAEQYPATNAGWGVMVLSLHERIVGDVERPLWLLMGVVGFLLLIACANVANLMLARSASRRQEIAIRTALGAGRWRIARQLLTESVLIALAGGAVGSLLAMWGTDALVALSPGNIPRLSEVGLDWKVLGFALALSLATGLLFGLAPALLASSPNLSGSLKEGGGRGSTEGSRGKRLRSALVVAEIALALVLLAGAGLMARSFAVLQHVDPGFKGDRVLTADLSLPAAKYKENPQVVNFFGQLAGRVAALPGVEKAAAVSALPLAGGVDMIAFSIEGRPEPPAEQVWDAEYRVVTPGYFETLSIPLIRGETITERHTADQPAVTVINETMARKFWPNEDPIGKRINLGNPETSPWRTVIGVVRDTKHEGLDKEAYAQMYAPFAQFPRRSMTVVARTAGDPLGLVAGVRREVAAIDKDQPLSNALTMERVLADSVARQRFQMTLTLIFAGVGLLLAAVGIYGVVSYTVAQRTHEFGVRIALGAQGRDVLGLVVRHGIVLAAAGVGVGLLGSLLLARLLSSLLYGVSTSDPLTFAGVSLLLTGVALLACYVPARRATRVDPLTALRHE
ncbi:MAG TPA: ABC transporter permease [Pyrinomonadaceae bacterium]|nr:ABC transporter permease [Pyrinomonadaceae bacterium]